MVLKFIKRLFLLSFSFATICCNNTVSKSNAAGATYKTIGTLARIDPGLDVILDGGAQAKVISNAHKWQGKKFNSTTHAVYNSDGEVFFTDPPFGWEKQLQEPKKEISFQGVYKVKKDGEIILLIASLTRPNGIAFLPGERTMIVANSDPQKPYWYAFDIAPNDNLTSARIFYKASGYDSSAKGLPDGLKIDKRGNIFATG